MHRKWANFNFGYFIHSKKFSLFNMLIFFWIFGCIWNSTYLIFFFQIYLKYDWYYLYALFLWLFMRYLYVFVKHLMIIIRIFYWYQLRDFLVLLNLVPRRENFDQTWVCKGLMWLDHVFYLWFLFWELILVLELVLSKNNCSFHIQAKIKHTVLHLYTNTLTKKTLEVRK